MLLFENLKLALTAIRVNKMRSFLTMLGMIIGIGSVIAIVSLGDTMRTLFAKEYENIGVGLAYSWIRSETGYYGDEQLFTYDDLEKIEKALGNDLDYLAPSSGDQITITYKKKSTKVSLSGCYYNFQESQPVDIVAGRMITDRDVAGEKPYIVIKDEDAIDIFGTENVVGKTFRATRGENIEEFKIIGVYTTHESALMKLMGGGNTTPVAYVPTTFILPEYSQFFDLNLVIKEDKNIDKFQERFSNYIARLKNTKQELIYFMSAAKEMSSVDGMLSGLSMIVGAIAAISLLVGGIGIMNIMLVSVTERTREIGIRKALGARTGDVLLQFLIESAIISAAGGFIGTALGIGVVTVGTSMFGLPVVVKPQIVIVAVAFSAVVGMFFGLYPASKAAKSDPITALRYE